MGFAIKIGLHNSYESVLAAGFFSKVTLLT